MARRRARDNNFGLLLGLSGLGVLAFSFLSKSASPAIPAGPTTAPLMAGTPYLFVVRLSALEDAARATIESKGGTMIEFSPAINPPFWATSGEAFSTSVVSFKATPAGNSTVSLGDDFYGIGRLERVIRL
jgi:hypothetical protein